MLYYKATAGCGVGMFVGVSARKRAAPVALILGRVAALPPPSAAFLSPLRHTRCTLTGKSDTDQWKENFTEGDKPWTRLVTPRPFQLQLSRVRDVYIVIGHAHAMSHGNGQHTRANELNRTRRRESQPAEEDLLETPASGAIELWPS